MKKIYAFILLNILLNNLFAQDFEWARLNGKYAYDYGYGIVMDTAGNVYVTGKYEENAVFSGTTLPNQGNHDVYVAQYSPSGNLNWIRTAGGFDGDYAHAIATNKTSHVYVAGEVEGGTATIVFPGSSITLNPAGNNDVFLAAYDLNGTIEWARTDGYIYNEKALGAVCDDAGNIVICGYYTDTTKFGGSLVSSKGEEDLFVAKYDANGNFLWMRNAGGPGRDEGKSVVSDASGNIYVCGMYSDGAVFGASTYTVSNTSIGKFGNGYIAKYDPAGTLIWVKPIGGDYTDIAWSVTIDNAGKLYVSGEFSGADFIKGNEWTNGMADIFVACYDQNGVCQWASHGGGPVADRARGISCYGGNIFVTGQYGLNANFGTHYVSAADSADIFVAALDKTGNFLWIKTVGGAADAFEYDGYESGNAICAGQDIAYATGAILDGGDFGTISLTGYTRTDAFVTKLSTVVSVPELHQNNTATIYPNPAKDKLKVITSHDLESARFVVYNLLGQPVLEQMINRDAQVDLRGLKSGIYTYILSGDNRQVQNGKLIIE